MPSQPAFARPSNTVLWLQSVTLAWMVVELGVSVFAAVTARSPAMMAFVALITLAGLALNAAFHIPWFDSLAALVAIPILIKEGRFAWHGHGCGCC
jgi:divalent metal cation (Fe/Co/Zn/Cd) transporter